MNLGDPQKSICVIWDIPSLDTRFVTREHSGLVSGAAGTTFVGARSQPSKGARFEVTRARLELGDSQFVIPDVNEAVTSWLATNDAQLSQVRVIKRQGLVGQAEADYALSYWLLDDYAVESKAGGSYKFYLANAFKSFSNSLYGEFSNTSYRLGGAEEQGGLKYDDSSVLLEDVEEDAVFEKPGLLLVVDNNTNEQELIYYTGIQGNSRFTGLTRNYLGVGSSNSGNKNFLKESTSVFPVWARRNNPITQFLEWLTTSDATAESASNHVPNGDVDDWTGGVPDNWTELGTVDEETTIVHTAGGSSAKLSFGGANAWIVKNGADRFNLTEGKGYYFEFWIYVTDASNAFEDVRIRIRNESANKMWKAETQKWITYDSTWTDEYEVSSFGRWIRFHITFETESGMSPTDNYSVQVACMSNSGSPVAYVDDIVLHGPYDKKPNGPYDQLDGKGAAVPVELVNLQQIEEIRDTYWPEPTFDATNGNKTDGTAVLFVENERIDDLKEFAEDHLLLPYGLKPLVDGSHRLVLDRYHSFFPSETTIGDKWVKRKFNAAKWRRNFAKTINNFTILTDFDLSEGELTRSFQYDHDPGIDAYGRSKALELKMRGGRTGRNGFPQYDSVSDGEIGASRVALETSNPWSLLEIHAFYEFRDLSQLDAVLLNVPSIPDLANGVRGLTNARFFIDAVKIDEQKGYVTLTVRERRSSVEQPALIGISGLPDYGAASAAQKVYAYIGTGTADFGDGASQYEII